jgi:hypothetical protein
MKSLAAEPIAPDQRRSAPFDQSSDDLPRMKSCPGFKRSGLFLFELAPI